MNNLHADMLRVVQREMDRTLRQAKYVLDGEEAIWMELGRLARKPTRWEQELRRAAEIQEYAAILGLN